jgi:MFS transporter, DHA2 family, multidrug resistance protein
MAVGLGCFETVLEEGEKNDWFGSSFIVRLAVIAAVSLCAFIWVELKRPAPLLNLRLLARRNFGLGSCANFVFGFSMFGWIYLIPEYLSRMQGYSSQQIGGVMIWIGLPQLVLIPCIPRIMRYVDSKRLVIIGYILFVVGSMLAAWLSDNFSGPQFLSASLVRAVAQGMMMAPLAGIAIAGIEHEYAGSASALFNALRNLGGAVGIAVIQTFLTKREQFHSAILNSQASLLTESTRQRLNMLTGHFLNSGVSDRAYAYREAVVAVGRDIRHQAFMLGYSDTIIMQSAVLALGLAAVVFVRKVAQVSAEGAGH